MTKLIKTAPGYVEKTERTAKWTGKKKRCGVCQITKAAKHFEGKRQVCNECRKEAAQVQSKGNDR
jgi:hypothetical protein